MLDFLSGLCTFGKVADKGHKHSDGTTAVLFYITGLDRLDCAHSDAAEAVDNICNPSTASTQHEPDTSPSPELHEVALPTAKRVKFNIEAADSHALPSERPEVQQAVMAEAICAAVDETVATLRRTINTWPPARDMPENKGISAFAS